jgi:hypothetical protein
MVAYLGIAAILSWVIRKHSIEETIKHPLAFGAYAGWTLVSTIFITPLALLTMDSSDWGTRAKQQIPPAAPVELPEVPLGNTTV